MGIKREFDDLFGIHAVNCYWVLGYAINYFG